MTPTLAIIGIVVCTLGLAWLSASEKISNETRRYRYDIKSKNKIQLNERSRIIRIKGKS